MNPFFDRFTAGVEGIPRHDIAPQRVGKKTRLLYKPNEAMTEVQKRILAFLQKHAPTFQTSYSRKGGRRGAVRNARQHLFGSYRYRFDIADAFPSTNLRRLADDIARRVGWTYRDAPGEDEWWEFLQQYAVSETGGLPEGAHTSPFLFDWYCEVFLDRHLRLECRTWEGRVVYTRYVDDLVFSTYRRFGQRTKRPFIRAVLERAGFRENYQKTEIAVRWSNPMRITGPLVGAQMGVPRAWLKDLERMLYQAKVIGVKECGHNPAVLHGKTQYLLDVLRGKRVLTSLEEKVLRLYVWYAQATQVDASWAQITLKRKGKAAQKKSKRAPL